ncbi:hypothetical protein P3T18_005402 [Paraburkholderia sp. GAS199]|uniref:hypothetical protein n=1 Tax=Paraburkholderia sp. GAS199 TaxID=3035126 RepID=UPI003D193707
MNAKQKRERLAAGMRRIDAMLSERGIVHPSLLVEAQRRAEASVPVRIVDVTLTYRSVTAAAHAAADRDFDAGAHFAHWDVFDTMIEE